LQPRGGRQAIMSSWFGNVLSSVTDSVSSAAAAIKAELGDFVDEISSDTQKVCARTLACGYAVKHAGMCVRNRAPLYEYACECNDTRACPCDVLDASLLCCIRGASCTWGGGVASCTAGGGCKLHLRFATFITFTSIPSPIPILAFHAAPALLYFRYYFSPSSHPHKHAALHSLQMVETVQEAAAEAGEGSTVKVGNSPRHHSCTPHLPSPTTASRLEIPRRSCCCLLLILWSDCIVARCFLPAHAGEAGDGGVGSGHGICRGAGPHWCVQVSAPQCCQAISGNAWLSHPPPLLPSPPPPLPTLSLSLSSSHQSISLQGSTSLPSCCCMERLVSRTQRRPPVL